jgi:hypothetical protein
MFLPLALVLLLALIWTVYWFMASSIAKDRLAQERARMSAQGLQLSCTSEGWGGYPFHFEFSCSSPVLTYAGKAELRAADLLLVALAYAPWQVAALITGPTTISGPGLVPTEVRHQRALAAVTFGKSWQPSFSAELPAVAITGVGSADKLTVFTRPAAEGGTDVAVEATGMTYAPDGKPPVSMDSGNLLGTLQNDQAFRLDKFELSQGPLRYWGTGKLSLDGQHRIAGQIDTETNDIQKLLATAGPYLGLTDSKLANLRTMLGLLGNGAKAPVIAKDGVLYLGPFQVTELKPLY